MKIIEPSRPNAYTGSPLDRAGHLRSRAAWIAEALADAGTRFVPLWRGQNLLSAAPDGTLEAMFPTGLPVAEHPWAFLGQTAGISLFAVDLGAFEAPPTLVCQGAGEFMELRGATARLPPAQAAILAHARGLMHWRSRHRFCGVCGAACESQNGGHVLVCTACGIHHFPRTDPAVIMLVVSGDRVLLGQSRRFLSSQMYSTLAGFVEPGESLEEAVAREVMEESGIRVGRVSYHSSQPWPFPGNIMLGFYADALSEEITVDTEELCDARWFGRKELVAPADYGFALPRADSIARRLIEDWIAS